MSILVTGGAGYIGSHCVRTLLRQGNAVVVYDNLSTGHAETVDALRQYASAGGELAFVRGDLHDLARLRETMLRFDVEAVMHFAAFSQVEESSRQPLKYYFNNTAGAFSLLEAMRQAAVRHLVFSSSAAVYGAPEQSPIEESHPTHPLNPYGHSKLLVEQALEKLSQASSSEGVPLRYVTLRYFNAAGADAEGFLGEWHEPETHLIPTVLKNLYAKQPVLIYGSDYPTADGTCVRDYVHVDDIVEAHLLALDYLKRGGTSQVLNLGTERGYSVRQVVEACQRVSGLSIPIKLQTPRPGDPASLVASSTKARALLNWQPRYTHLDTIIATAWQWEQNLQQRLAQLRGGSLRRPAPLPLASKNRSVHVSN